MKKKYKKGIEASAGLMREDEEQFAAAYHKQFEDFFAFIEQNNVRVKDAVEMHLADLPFEQIRSGGKTVEIRLYDEKRREIHEGDIIMFYRKDRSEWIRARVKTLHRAPTFAELFEMPNMLAKAGFADMLLADAVNCMYQYYSAEQERRYGVLGIELCDLKQ